MNYQHHLLLIEHGKKVKKFQWKNSYSLADFKGLLLRVFHLSCDILGLRDIDGNFYELDYFTHYPEDLKTEYYQLVLNENRNDVEFTNGNGNVEKMGLKSKYLNFLERAFDDGFLSEEDYYFLKCLFFEQPHQISKFLKEILNNNDYQTFLSVIPQLLPPKKSNYSKIEPLSRPLSSYKTPKGPNRIEFQNFLSPNSDKSFILRTEPNEKHIASNYSHRIENHLQRPQSPNPREGEIFELFESFCENNKLNVEEKRKLKELVNQKCEILEASFEVFKSNEDIDDFDDTLKRLLNRVRRDEEGKRESEKKKSFFVEKKETKKQNSQTLDKKKPSIDSNVIPKKIENIESQRRNSNSKGQKNMLDLIFSTFLEETESEFEPLEIGFARHLYSISDPEVLSILNTCESIEKAVILFKNVTKKAYTDFLNMNFDNRSKEIILSERNERSSEICSILYNFKTDFQLEKLLKVLKAVTQTKGSKISTKYADVAMQRCQNKKTSFKMMLHREIVASSQKNLSARDSEMPLVVTLGQEENDQLSELLKTYFEKEESELRTTRNKDLLKEIFDKSKFLTNQDKIKLESLLKENNFELLTVLSKFESLNKSIPKIKTKLKKVLEEETITLSKSPTLSLKRKKYHLFKQILNEIHEKFQLISLKQVKLFQYLFIEEDLTILGVFEVYCVTNEVQDFIENLVLIDKYHYFKTKLDFDEIEQFDKKIESQLELLFMFKRHLTNDQRINLEKMCRAGDDGLLKIFEKCKTEINDNKFLNCLKQLADEKTKEVNILEERIKQERQTEKGEKKRMETIETFQQSKFLKKIIHMDLIASMVEQKHKLIDALFEIYDMNKNKEDFIENITMIYEFSYKQNFKRIISNFGREMKLQKAQIHFLHDCIDLDIPHVLAPYEVFMNSEESLKDKENELKDSLKIILRLYVNEINLLEKKYYQ